jgi:threonine dehydrogenase-like Zn-dependent dehydrogenase
MRALTWHGNNDVRVDTHPDPEILNPRDAILKVTSTAICGSDLHLYDGVIPGLKSGDILGHEFMGEVVEVGPKSTLQIGQRVVVPFIIPVASASTARSCSFRPATMAILSTSRMRRKCSMATPWALPSAIRT